MKYFYSLEGRSVVACNLGYLNNMNFFRYLAYYNIKISTYYNNYFFHFRGRSAKLRRLRHAETSLSRSAVPRRCVWNLRHATRSCHQIRSNQMYAAPFWPIRSDQENTHWGKATCTLWGSRLWRERWESGHVPFDFSEFGLEDKCNENMNSWFV